MTSRTPIDHPLIAVVGFNLFTLIVLATAPVEWDTPTNTFVALYLLVMLCQLLIIVGFQLGRASGFASPAETLPFSSDATSMNYLFVLYASTCMIGYAYRMGFPVLDIAGMYNLLLEGVKDRHFGYEMALRGSGLGPVPWRIYFIISISNQLFFIAGFLQWKRFNSLKKVLFVIFVGIELFFSIGRGTAFGVVSMVTTFFFSSMLWINSTHSRLYVIGKLLLVVFLFVGSIALFSYNLYSRSGDIERSVQLSDFGKSTIITDNIAFAFVPESLQPSYINVLSYLSGGYYHTSLAFDLEFKSTWFLGNNPALIGLASVFGIDVWDNTYIYRLEVEKGVDQLRSWHSAYTWFASDVSFYGVPFLLCGLAYLFGFSWAKAVQGDFLSKLVFIIFGNILLFLFANNTYLSTVFYSFMFLVPLWFVTRFFGRARAAARGLPSRSDDRVGPTTRRLRDARGAHSEM
jgi:hypothetical protein